MRILLVAFLCSCASAAAAPPPAPPKPLPVVPICDQQFYDGHMSCTKDKDGFTTTGYYHFKSHEL